MDCDISSSRWKKNLHSMIPKRSKGASQMRLNFYLFWNDIHVHWRKHSLCIRCTSWYHHFMSIDNFRYVMLASFSFSTNFLSCSLMCRNENSQHAGIHMTTLLVSTVIEPQSVFCIWLTHGEGATLSCVCKMAYCTSYTLCPNSHRSFKYEVYFKITYCL